MFRRIYWLLTAVSALLLLVVVLLWVRSPYRSDALAFRIQAVRTRDKPQLADQALESSEALLR